MTPISRLRRACGILGALTLQTACATDFPSGLDNIGWVTTLVDTTSSSLATARTFAIPDTIVELRGQSGLNHAADAQVADAVRSHFLLLGWREIELTSVETPDVVIVMGALSQTEVGYVYSDWFGAWGWLPYWGPTVDPTWVWGAPVGAVPYVYEVGTLVVTMVDLRAPREVTRQVPLLWVASINGVLNGSANLPRALKGVDQAFRQSPYLEVE